MRGVDDERLRAYSAHYELLKQKGAAAITLMAMSQAGEVRW